MANAGGVGMMLYNQAPGLSLTGAHPLGAHCASRRREWIGDQGLHRGATATAATASIAQATLVYDVPAPFTASFSSRGPLRAGGGDLLKPDIIAPGQDILAGVAPPNNSDRLFDLYSGTSMSSPHVAGLAALLKAGAPRLVADDDQVGADDHRL